MNSLEIAKIDATWPPPLPLLPLLVFDDLRWPLLRQLAASVDGQKQGEGEGGGLFLIWATECCRLNSCLAKFYGLARPNLIIVASDRLRFRFHILFVLPFLHVCITFAPQLSPHPSTLIRYSQSLGRMKSRDAFFFGILAKMPLCPLSAFSESPFCSLSLPHSTNASDPR